MPSSPHGRSLREARYRAGPETNYEHEKRRPGIASFRDACRQVYREDVLDWTLLRADRQYVKIRRTGFSARPGRDSVYFPNQTLLQPEAFVE